MQEGATTSSKTGATQEGATTSSKIGATKRIGLLQRLAHVEIALGGNKYTTKVNGTATSASASAPTLNNGLEDKPN